MNVRNESNRKNVAAIPLKQKTTQEIPAPSTSHLWIPSFDFLNISKLHWNGMRWRESSLMPFKWKLIKFYQKKSKDDRAKIKRRTFISKKFFDLIKMLVSEEFAVSFFYIHVSLSPIPFTASCQFSFSTFLILFLWLLSRKVYKLDWSDFSTRFPDSNLESEEFLIIIGWWKFC